jgi:hypothetical protein
MPKQNLPARDLDDHKLVAAMRARESDAFEEFFERFAPLLREEASRLRIQPAHREEAVVECLEHAAIFLIKETAAIPVSVARDLVIRFAADHSRELRIAEDRPADLRALAARRSLTGAEAAQTAVDAERFGKRIRARVGQRRAP